MTRDEKHGAIIVIAICMIVALLAWAFGYQCAKIVNAAESAHVRVTYYTITGIMYHSRDANDTTRLGMAACSYNFPAYTRLQFKDGRIVECRDRGMLGSTGWVDVWVPSSVYGRDNIASVYGDYTDVEILRWGLVE